MVLAMPTFLDAPDGQLLEARDGVLHRPLGIVGASIALNLAGKPFGFVALLGLIALAGMDMRNTVILVEQIESGRAANGA